MTETVAFGSCVVAGCQRSTQYGVGDQFWCYQDAPQSLRDYWFALNIPYLRSGHPWVPSDEWESIMESAEELGPFGIVPESAA